VGGFSVLEIGVTGVVPITSRKLGHDVPSSETRIVPRGGFRASLMHYEPRFGNLNSAE
jgi:hypothetical protein